VGIRVLRSIFGARLLVPSSSHEHFLGAPVIVIPWFGVLIHLLVNGNSN
jgi:hypothetical protein